MQVISRIGVSVPFSVDKTVVFADGASEYTHTRTGVQLPRGRVGLAVQSPATLSVALRVQKSDLLRPSLALFETFAS
jgi:hypothetical protein